MPSRVTRQAPPPGHSPLPHNIPTGMCHNHTLPCPPQVLAGPAAAAIRLNASLHMPCLVQTWLAHATFHFSPSPIRQLQARSLHLMYQLTPCSHAEEKRGPIHIRKKGWGLTQKAPPQGSTHRPLSRCCCPSRRPRSPARAAAWLADRPWPWSWVQRGRGRWRGC